MIPLQLTYDPQVIREYQGWYLPGTSLDAWLAAVAEEPPSQSTQYFLAPQSLRDTTTCGLLALRKAVAGQSSAGQADSRDRASAHCYCPAGAVPLWCWKPAQGEFELWMPLFSKPDYDVPVEQLVTQADLVQSQTYVWLPPHIADEPRLLRLVPEDEVDLSWLVRPMGSPHSQSLDDAPTRQWSQPPVFQPLPKHITGLQVHHDMLPPNPFSQEQATIGGDSDDLMSLENDGRLSVGGPSAIAKRLFRKSLAAIAKSLAKKLAKNQEAPQKPPGRADGSPARSTDRQGESGSMPGAGLPGAGLPGAGLPGAGLPGAIGQKLLNMLAAQRNQQIEKLLKLMQRNPDEALKLAPPMAGLGAPRGIAQPGSTLGPNNVNFSLTALFGGGRAADYWDVSPQLRAQLTSAYRQQAVREIAAQRYRRAAYIYAHLIGDLLAAAMTLEKGKFYLEAARLFEHLQRTADQARCLRMSGQLTEAAELYQQLKDFDAAAEMWTAVGDLPAAQQAYEKAVEAALSQHQILKAAQILDSKLQQIVRAEELLWSQWPRGHQVYDCVCSAFKQLAEQGRHAEASRRFEEIVQLARACDQTLLAQVSAELYRYFPNAALRQRVEDQCRLSVAHRLRIASPNDLQARMQILSRLHPDDLLLQRDTRRYERELAQSELKLQTEPAGKREEHLQDLPGTQLQSGEYLAAMMIHQQLFAVWRTSRRLNFGRYAQLLDAVPAVLHTGWDTNYMDNGPVYCRFDRSSMPKQILVAYGQATTSNYLLTSPLGGDDFWLVKLQPAGNAVLVGVSDQGDHWWWTPHNKTLLRAGDEGKIPYTISMADFLQTRARQNELTTSGSEFPDGTPSDTAVLVDGRPFISHGNSIVTIVPSALVTSVPSEVAWLPEPIRWMVPSPPRTTPRLLVATASGLYLVHIDSTTRPEKIAQDEVFTGATFLLKGLMAVTTNDELVLFRNNGQSITRIDRFPLEGGAPIAVLQLSLDSVGVLSRQGQMQRWRVR